MWIVRGGGGRSSFAPARRPSRRPRPDKWEGLGSNNNTFHLREVFFVLVGARGACQTRFGISFGDHTCGRRGTRFRHGRDAATSARPATNDGVLPETEVSVARVPNPERRACPRTLSQGTPSANSKITDDDE